MLNRIIVQGRITKDLDLRRTQSGTPVLPFTLAVERDFKNADGDKEIDFIDCVAWRSTAEFISKYFGKGRMMVADGQLQSRKFEDKNGNKRTAWEVQVANAYFADSRKDTSNTYDEDEATQPPQFAEIEKDGELPF